MQKVTCQIGLKKLLQLKKLKILFRGPMLLAMLKVRKLLECLMEKKCKKQIKKNLGQKM